MVRSLGRIELLAILAVGLIASAMMLTGSVPGSWTAVASLFALLMVMWIISRDIRDFIVPDGAVVGLVVAGVLVRLGAAESWPVELATAFLDAAVCGGVFLVIREAFFRLRGFDGMGFGDVKLAAACGVLIGYEGFAWSVFAASTAGLIIAAFSAALRPEQRITRLPFGAFLAPACWLVWLIQLSGVT